MTWSLIGYVGNLVSLVKFSYISQKKKKWSANPNDFKSIDHASK